MNDKEKLEIESLLSEPHNLLKKKPFSREVCRSEDHMSQFAASGEIPITGTVTATLPRVKRKIIPQTRFARELDVFSHDVLFDENIPAICVKVKDNNFVEIKHHRMGVPFQVLIRDKQVRHLCVNPINHILLNPEPSDIQQNNFILLKQKWSEKNMEGAKTKFVKTVKSYADGGLLFFIDRNNDLKTRNISFEDGYVIITHKNDEGKHILECLYYEVSDLDGNNTVYLDCYDDEKITRFTNDETSAGLSKDGWVRHEPVYHGFPENPLITKRGEVAWNRGQLTIESYEALYNIFVVIQKRHGWGALYVKGKLQQFTNKVAGAVVLNDTSLDSNADAKYLVPPSPQNIIETLELMEQTIMKSCGTTFILPKDIKISGDTSGLAVEMTQELDMATAQDGVIEWQNVASKMMRLFKAGIAIEQVRKGINAKAATELGELRIFSEFQVWKPKSEEGHNQMLATLYANGNGGISRQTYIERNTISAPDEMHRIKSEHDEQLREQEEQAEKAAALAAKTSKKTIATE